MKKQWEVTIICKVKKLVTCEKCTEDEARENPFEYAVDEMEIDQIDWEVIDVQEAS